MSRSKSDGTETAETNIEKSSKKRKDLENQNTITSFFKQNTQPETNSKIVEEKEPEPVRKSKRIKSQSKLGAENAQKITLFLKKDPCESEPKKSTPKLPQSKKETVKAKTEAPINIQPKIVANANTKKNFLAFYIKFNKEYDNKLRPMMQSMIEKLSHQIGNDTANPLVEKIFHATMKQYIRSSPDQLWNNVYKPICEQELIDDSMTKLIKYWLTKFNLNLQTKNEDSNGNSDSSSSLLIAEQIKLERQLQENLDKKYQEIIKEMNFKCLLIYGNEGAGKSTIIQTLSNELNYELIEISIVNNRSGANLDTMIYEATQSQNLFSKQEQKSQNEILKEKDEDGEEKNQALVQKKKIEKQKNPNKSTNGSLILVKDFDKSLDVDKGFQNKILKLAETSKSPFILICETIPDKILVQNQNISNLTIDKLFSSKKDNITLGILFYTILLIETYFSKAINPLRFKMQSIAPEFSETLIDQIFEEIKNVIIPEDEIVMTFEQIKKLVDFFEGDLNQCFSKFEFYFKDKRKLSANEIYQDSFLNKDLSFKRVLNERKGYFRDDFYKFYQFGSQSPDHTFSIDKNDIATINNIEQLYFGFEGNLEMYTSSAGQKLKKLSSEPQNDLDGVTKQVSILEDLAVIDILETKVLKRKRKLDYDLIDRQFENTNIFMATTNSPTIFLKSDQNWSVSEHGERVFTECKSAISDSLSPKMIDSSPSLTLTLKQNDKKLHWLPICHLKADLIDILRESYINNIDKMDINDLIMNLGLEENYDYQGYSLKGRLRNSVAKPIEEEKQKIANKISIYIKSSLAKLIKEIKRDVKFSKDQALNNLIISSTNETELDELIKIMMKYSIGFQYDQIFKLYETQVLCE